MGVLTGKPASILGASAGIARASARLLAADGATLFLLGRSNRRLAETKVSVLEAPESSWMTGQSFAIDGGNEVRGAPRGPMFTV